MDVIVMQSQVGGSSKKRKKMRRRRERKKQAMIEAQNKHQMHDNLEASEKTSDCKVANENLEKNLLETDLTLQPLAGNPKMDGGSTETQSEGSAKKKRKKRLKKKKNKVTVVDEAQSIGQTNAGEGSTENPVEGNGTGKRKRKRRKIKKATILDEAQGMGQTNTDAESQKNLGEGNVSGKRKKKRRRTKNEETKDVTMHFSSSDVGQTNTDAESKKNPGEGNVSGKRKKKRRRTKKEETKDVTTHFSSSDVKDVECLCPKKAPITSVRRKLIVLDVNGILADIVKAPQKQCEGDTRISGRAIYRRPFCDDFLKFCFQNFDVGIWSSRSKIILHKVVDYLLGDLKHKLLFCWDVSHSTQTGFRTLENCHKPLVCKELSKIWENDVRNMRWKKGDYNESNTLLLDDSPYKALVNPLHTAIFPYPYSFVDKNDNLLGPGGDLRFYLEGLLTSESVQKYVEQHPFGQKAIDERNSSWGFYAGVLNRVSN